MTFAERWIIIGYMIDARECSHKQGRIVPQFIPGNRDDVYMFPKYVPQLKKYCVDCGKFLGFEKQTPELIKELNAFFEKALFLVSVDI